MSIYATSFREANLRYGGFTTKARRAFEKGRKTKTRTAWAPHPSFKPPRSLLKEWRANRGFTFVGVNQFGSDVKRGKNRARKGVRLGARKASGWAKWKAKGGGRGKKARRR